jgi:FtsH-binding integral membrane protein
VVAVPPVALRTYTALRISTIAVILGLGIAVATEVGNADGCVQRSISAYYYTPVRSVFVGALVTIGIVMIVLWGKTPWEDAFLNLAGMLAPVVAFVPTLDANYCSLRTTAGADLARTAEEHRARAGVAKQALIAGNQDSVDNNFVTLMAVFAIMLAGVALWGLYQRSRRAGPLTQEVLAYGLTWLAALVLWVLGAYAYLAEDSWFDHKAHSMSAIIMFVFIIAAVVAAGFEKKADPQARGVWKHLYWVLAGLMVASFVVIAVGAAIWDDTAFSEHRTFLIEAALISLLAVFWMLQTVDRRRMGAPDFARPVQRPTDEDRPAPAPV